MASGPLVSSLNALALPGLLQQQGLVRAASRRPSLAEGLNHWLGWTDAAPLFEALQGPVPAWAPNAAAVTQALAAHGRLHAQLSRQVADEPLLPQRGGQRMAAPQDFADVRPQWIALQHRLQRAVSGHRLQLRQVLAQLGDWAARLAALDALWERVLQEREQGRLAMLPSQAEGLWTQAMQAGRTPAQAWAEVEPRLRALMQAEQALRWQPAAGLADALRQALGQTAPPKLGSE